ncbi:MAG: DUF6266 family protein [Chitinophagaceae bacterium]
MGKFINGINGPVQGKVGTIIGSSWKGIPYVKSKHKKRTKNVSEKEEANRTKFASAHSWLRPLLSFVRTGFKGYSVKAEGFNAAKSYLLRNAVEESPDGFRIMPSLMKLSVGDLPLPATMSVTKMAADKLQFTWEVAQASGAHGRDQVMMMAYDTDNQKAFFVTNGLFRSAGADILTVYGKTGSTYHLYAAFVAVDRSRQSDSMYLGEITM